MQHLHGHGSSTLPRPGLFSSVSALLVLTPINKNKMQGEYGAHKQVSSITRQSTVNIHTNSPFTHTHGQILHSGTDGHAEDKKQSKA